ncbi:MAG: LysR family transcriptional regulator [Streptosporangiales bacterium]|nr:LysR family transcriptional regulator [Streptosporangiales bacterium]
MPLHDPALQYFLTVLETGTINAAARRLYVASSAISRQITRLETELGTTLFERHQNGRIATDAAHAFAGFARRAIQEATHIVDEVHERQRLAARYTIAATDGTGHDLLPELLTEFHAAHPKARFVVQLHEAKAVTQAVRDGTADLGITFSLAIDSGVTILYAQQAPLRAVMRLGHPLADTAPLTLAEVAAYPLALSSLATTNRRLVEACGASHGQQIEAVFECDNPDALVRFVRNSDAVTFLGQVTLPHQPADVVTVPLREQEFGQRTLQVQCRAGRSLPQAVSSFANFLVDALEQRAV